VHMQKVGGNLAHDVGHPPVVKGQQVAVAAVQPLLPGA
jgi:hypothetical protein